MGSRLRCLRVHAEAVNVCPRRVQRLRRLCGPAPELLSSHAPVPPFGSATPPVSCSSGPACHAALLSSSLHASRLALGIEKRERVQGPFHGREELLQRRQFAVAQGAVLKLPLQASSRHVRQLDRAAVGRGVHHGPRAPPFHDWKLAERSRCELWIYCHSLSPVLHHCKRRPATHLLHRNQVQLRLSAGCNSGTECHPRDR